MRLSNCMLPCCGKAKFCLRMVRWFFPGFPVYAQLCLTINDWLDISEIRAVKKKKKNVKMLKKKKKKKC